MASINSADTETIEQRLDWSVSYLNCNAKSSATHVVKTTSGKQSTGLPALNSMHLGYSIYCKHVRLLSAADVTNLVDTVLYKLQI